VVVGGHIPGDQNNNIFMKVLFFLLSLVMILSCSDSIDVDYVKSKMWSYEKGYKVGQGDFINFDNKHKMFDIKEDTIYYGNIPKAIIIKVNKPNFELTLSSLNRKETGVYRNIEESLR
jgi:hypothetical protein